MSDIARVESKRTGHRFLVRVLGEIDMSNAHELGTAIGDAVPKDATELVVDLTGTTYLDSVGIAMLLRLANRLRSRRRAMLVLVPAGAPGGFTVPSI